MTAAPHADIARLRRTHPQLFSRPLSEKLRDWALWLGFFALLGFGLWWIDASPMRLIAGLNKLGLLVTLMIPPWPGDGFWEYCQAMLETLAMAFLGTLIAAIVALPLGFLGAKNIVPNWLFHFSLRRFFDAFRGIDGLVWALIFVSAVGLGPFAGVLAIAVGDVMIFSKLFAEAIENTDRKPVEGVRASGGGDVHVMRLGVFPQVFPVMMSHVLYFFESNVRSATILGIVGAGGIGLQLSDRIRINNWQEAAFIILMILVTVSVIDAVSRRIRAKLT
ncbi:phosphonate ABC transporter, permease protein PhnE [Nitratireductor aquimarinus]|uniref:phosphonate ABC transporter, permease protein PhnE n=1 Tax=Alphaproteobacteria TaxID=28211 RepID=UPI000DE0520A|nr:MULTISPECIES: phosphonate ABC transporter, permease protein PhnE [Alphaproteobacteria]MBY6024689.1 phosphonate ABC transporter, permease protein PhnE [Nitratireductor sp. DP7N14-4]MBN7759438.1 phosphonate ABC transporter, permease protein PhnE [Nitratireductor aquimarinus]MBN8243719.1 phosphonate ABC transporter, permease protein PhnE [Nitratireductor aquimarinus]MBY6002233.1 phosphonate ABC transporter, permease protein PhnE [Tritonibacter mobilis]MBY6132436.1 phosphonate ABC transporter, 